MTPALSVTVVVCAYNYAHYLPAALDSVLAQTYPSELIELLVVDDGSTDDTPGVLAGYGDRLRVLRQENAGLNAATERGIRAANGDLVAILDADDIWKPEKLARQIALFDGRPEVGLVFSDVEIMDADGRTTDPSHFGKHGMRPPRGRALGTFLQENFAPAPSIVFRRDLADHVLPFAPEASFQDWWLALRVAEVAEIDWVEAALVRYRVHGGNMAAGAGVDAWVKNVRKDNRFRRWMLRSLDLTAVSAADLLAAWKRFELHAAMVAQRAGVPLAEELVRGGRDAAACRASREAAASAGDDQERVRGYVAALAADPLDGAAREALQRHERTAGALETLARAEQAFESGDIATAGNLVLEVVREGVDDAGVMARAYNDLAVVAVAVDDLDAARLSAAHALASESGHVPALETLARCSAAAGDPLQAAHWFRRAAEREPGEPSLWLGLAESGAALGRWDDVAEAAERAAALGADAQAIRAVARHAESAAPGRAAGEARGRLLLCVDYFHPSIGGAERLAEEVGAGLAARGWDVHVATRPLPERRTPHHRGMVVHELEAGVDTVRALQQIADAVHADAVLAFSAPNAWPIPSALQLRQGPRVVVVPSVNRDNHAWLTEDANRLEAWRTLLQRADALVHCSHAGTDARLADDLGIASHYVPNSAEPVPGGAPFRAAAGLHPERPLLLTVGNLWPEKNHLGLIDALASVPGDWQLALVGHAAPGAPELARRIADAAARDPRITVCGGASPETVAAAMRDADLLLHPSRAEANGLVLLEAMAAELPWIATPACGAAPDFAGGLIADVEHFGLAIGRLLADADTRRRLGAAGRDHWSAQFTHDAVVDRYDALLRGADALPAASAPAAALEVTAAERASFYDATVASLAEPEPSLEPPAAAATPYSDEFFDALQQGALRSARAMLPPVFDALAPKSVLDVGCGAGAWLSICAELGAEEIAGVDGDYVDRNRLAIPSAAFTPADLEAPLDLGRRFDLVMSLEVAEHLPQRAADAFVASLARHGDVVLFSAAIPNQGGVNHVNEQWPSYWAQRFAAHGFVAVDALRPRFWMHPAVEPWYAQNILLFVAEHRLADVGGLAAAAVGDGGPLALVHPRIFDARAERAAAATVTIPPAARDDLVIVADAAEAASDASLLEAYASTFGGGEATLVLYAPGDDAQQVAARLAPSLAAAGMDAEDGPEAILLCVPEVEGDALLRDRAVVTLGRSDALARFDGALRSTPESLSALAALST